MIGLNVKLDARPVVRALRRLPALTKKVTAQELNKQRTRSRTLITRDLSKRLNVRPQKRIRRRILLPRGGRARPDRLVATGLSLFESMPARYFLKGGRGRSRPTLQLPSGVRVRNTRATAGQPFSQVMPSSGKLLVLRRADPAKRREGPSGRTWLPIQEMMIDTRAPGFSSRAKALNTLAKAWPNQFERRMDRELRRRFRA